MIVMKIFICLFILFVIFIGFDYFIDGYAEVFFSYILEKWDELLDKLINKINHEFFEDEGVYMTNGDRIRSMTDEELADFLTFSESCVCSHCKYNTDDTGCIGAIMCHKDHVRDVFKKYLSSEYEDKKK